MTKETQRRSPKSEIRNPKQERRRKFDLPSTRLTAGSFWLTRLLQRGVDWGGFLPAGGKTGEP
jgi:hypothetical protein